MMKMKVVTKDFKTFEASEVKVKIKGETMTIRENNGSLSVWKDYD